MWKTELSEETRQGGYCGTPQFTSRVRIHRSDRVQVHERGTGRQAGFVQQDPQPKTSFPEFSSALVLPICTASEGGRVNGWPL